MNCKVINLFVSSQPVTWGIVWITKIWFKRFLQQYDSDIPINFIPLLSFSFSGFKLALACLRSKDYFRTAETCHDVRTLIPHNTTSINPLSVFWRAFLPLNSVRFKISYRLKLISFTWWVLTGLGFDESDEQTAIMKQLRALREKLSLIVTGSWCPPVFSLEC